MSRRSQLEHEVSLAQKRIKEASFFPHGLLHQVKVCFIFVP